MNEKFLKIQWCILTLLFFKNKVKYLYKNKFLLHHLRVTDVSKLMTLHKEQVEEWLRKDGARKAQLVAYPCPGCI